MADYETCRTTTPQGLDAELGRRLARIRLARNITQKAFSEEAGIGLRTLRRLESGASSTLDSFLRVAIALGLADSVLAAVPARDIHPNDMLRFARSCGLKKHAAPQIVDHVISAVKRWRALGADAGVDSEDIARIERTHRAELG